jgi:hypothetical protein
LSFVLLELQLDVFTLQRPVQCALCAAPWIVWSIGAWAVTINLSALRT